MSFYTTYSFQPRRCIYIKTNGTPKKITEILQDAANYFLI